ncbi:Ca2+-binding RTX toxin-like protein [Rhodoblastus acidophilus]|uniref:hypothetical protein n=1 Tax=Rhodoblastus acidophilus TaxID=1074 RepID=UPI0022254C7A|nr:hypothetical protein [Rhodoblastus acidophilus]MCW2286613.1 Ca2+-binding RTX toxin-like protein [Rhodoblastus acidophilus]MCW2335475.1 Ca2+-binding RTX toxin-like protein [Rhodoblastus acidophilus]
MNVANLGNGTILTTYVDQDAPHSFPSNLPGFTDFTTSGQLFVANAAPQSQIIDGQLVIDPTPQINVTDSAGGNFFATGNNADVLNITNLSTNVDKVWGSGTGETISLTGVFVASGTDGNASGHSTIIGGSDSVTHFHNTLWGGAGSDVLWGGGLSAIHAGNGAAQTLNGGRWANAADTLYTASGNDTVNTWNGNDVIYGWNNDGTGTHWQDGKNTINTGSGSDTIYSGQNTNIYGVGIGDTQHSGRGVTEVYGATVGGASSTIVTGQNDFYIGLDAGNASIQGGTGRLFVWNGSGSDTIKLGSGSDTINLTNTGSSSIVGGTGQDTVNYWSSASNATVLGGSNTTVNVVDQAASISGVTHNDGTTTFTFGSGSSAHSLTVDNKVHITWGHAADLTSFKDFKG